MREIEEVYEVLKKAVEYRSMNLVEDGNGKLSLIVCLAGLSFDEREAEPLLALLRVLPQLKNRTVRDVQFNLLPDDPKTNPDGTFAALTIDTYQNAPSKAI